MAIWRLGKGCTAQVPLSTVTTGNMNAVITGDIDAQWSPDASHLAVLCPTSSMEDRICVVSSADLALVCAIDTPAFDLAPRFSMFEFGWSPDCSQLVISFVDEASMATDLQDDHEHVYAVAVVRFVDLRDGENFGSGSDSASLACSDSFGSLKQLQEYETSLSDG